MEKTAARVRAYLAMSLDGFIAGPHDGLEWLTAQRPLHAPMASEAWDGAPSSAVTFEDFTSTVGCMLMGRRTYDVVSAMDGPWPYGEMPIIVATTRPSLSAHVTVQSASGDIVELLDKARDRADGRDVYVDGGEMVRQAIEAGLLDELIVTIVPIALGAGVSLFAGLPSPHLMTITNVAKYDQGLVQISLTPR